MARSDVRVTERQERAQFRVVDDIFRYHGAVRPDHPALIFEDQTVSYGLLDTRANRIAGGLIATGCDPQARIAHLGKNNSRYFELLAGCARANMVLAPISWRLALPEVLYLLDAFDVQALFIDAEYAGYLPEIRAACPALRAIVVIEGGAGDAPDFDAWRDSQSDAAPDVTRRPEDVVMQMHTSGTTGRPKGVMLSNFNVVSQVRYCETGEIGQWYLEDIVLVPLPVFHVGGTSFGLYALYLGATDFITREAGPRFILDAFASAPITKAGFVPAVMQMVINDPGFDPAHLSALGMVTFGGSPITLALLVQAQAALGCDFVQLFGMTESASLGTSMLLERANPPAPERLASCGRVLAGFRVRIVDAEGRDRPPGEVGEILLRGDTIMQGYYKQPDATASAIRDGWYHSGDAGYLDETGYLYIKDRIKDMIISGGENIYPAEVETAMAGHPAVLESAAIGVPSPKWGEEVKLYVVLRPGQSAAPEDLIAHCRSQIAGFKCPRSVEFIEALPRNPSGKILKRVLREPWWDAAGRAV